MPKKPKCIIVTGQAGSGKTTLAKKLGDRLWMPVISRDVIKEGYVNTFEVRNTDLAQDTDLYVTGFFFEVVGNYLNANVSVVIEAAFQHKVWEPRIAKIRESSSPFLIICSIDPQLAARRHLERGLANPERERFHGDNRVVHFRATGEFLDPAPYEPPDLDIPTIKVSTDGKYLPSIDNILKQIESHHNLGGFVEA